jgi:phosphoglucomutase
MAAHPRAGQRAQPEDLIDVAHVVTAYYLTFITVAGWGIL